MNARALDGEIIATRLDDWRAYEGVRSRRIFAFLLDYLFVGLLSIPFFVLVALLGVITLGAGWALFGLIFPAVALVYVWTTLGGPAQATTGMRMMGVRLDRLDGQPVEGVFAILHTVLFWGLNVVATPLILAASLVLDRKRTVHDLLLGTVVTRAER
ncbi:MAG: RDD family protein [Rhizobiaceae bacterium]